MTTATVRATIASPKPPYISARLLAPLERMPEQLLDNLQHLKRLDHNWIWVAEQDSEIIGYLLACYCHSMAMLLRLHVNDKAPQSVLVVLLRRFFDDVRTRGCMGYMTFFDCKNDAEKRLLALMRKTKGVVLPNPLLCAASPLPPDGI